MAYRHHVVRVLPYTAGRLFDLVGDVQAYPEFVPWIQSIRTGPVRTEEGGITVLDAEARVGFAFLKERFSTRVRRDAEALVIEVRLISGPFRRLLNTWRFVDGPNGAQVVFDIEFEFKSRLLDAMLNANFDLAVDRLIRCFEARAEALYGSAQAAQA